MIALGLYSQSCVLMNDIVLMLEWLVRTLITHYREKDCAFLTLVIYKNFKYSCHTTVCLPLYFCFTLVFSLLCLQLEVFLSQLVSPLFWGQLWQSSSLFTGHTSLLFPLRLGTLSHPKQRNSSLITSIQYQPLLTITSVVNGFKTVSPWQFSQFPSCVYKACAHRYTLVHTKSGTCAHLFCSHCCCCISVFIVAHYHCNYICLYTCTCVCILCVLIILFYFVVHRQKKVMILV